MFVFITIIVAVVATATNIDATTLECILYIERHREKEGE